MALGFSPEQVKVEALRCLQCKDPTCIDACPLHIDIKAFILALGEGDIEAAFEKISEQSPFPGICGRVCQHELFCEKACLMGKKLEPVAIGSLERFVARSRFEIETRNSKIETQEPGREERLSSFDFRVSDSPRIALVGSGPASLIAAFDLVRKGYRVTVFEALHELGGVLSYGIPNFRLPREILHEEIDRLRKMGVEFRTDFIVGQTCTVEELFAAGFDAVFLGTGAGLPHLMGIPGENLIGVYTANELLTRINLMQAYKFPEADTPVRVGKRTVVVGGGNSAMDAARWARRMGSETTIMFRRGRAELRARMEEIEHAEEEGVRFEFLAAPVRLFGDEKGTLARDGMHPHEAGRARRIGPALARSHAGLGVSRARGHGGDGDRTEPQPHRAEGHAAVANQARQDRGGRRGTDEHGACVCRRRCGARRIDRDSGHARWARRGGRRFDQAVQEQQSGTRNSRWWRDSLEISDIGQNLDILAKRQITPEIAWFEVEAPEVAATLAARTIRRSASHGAQASASR